MATKVSRGEETQRKDCGNGGGGLAEAKAQKDFKPAYLLTSVNATCMSSMCQWQCLAQVRERI